MKINKCMMKIVFAITVMLVLAIAANASVHYEQGVDVSSQVITVRLSSPKIDGKIEAGEYEEYTGGYTEWFIFDDPTCNYDDAKHMAETAKWYFAWDGKYLFIAAEFDAGVSVEQIYGADDYFGDNTYIGTDYYVEADRFLKFGPGLSIVSGEKGDKNNMARLYYAISENVMGEKMTGSYFGQNGKDKDYCPTQFDFDFTYDGFMDGFVYSFNSSKVVVEYRIPIDQLNENFVPDVGGQTCEASITLNSGCGLVNGVYNAWGVRIGECGYANKLDALNNHAKFVFERECVSTMGHDFSSKWTIDVEATLESAGLKSRHCSRCDAVTDEIVIAQLIDSSTKFTDVLTTSWAKSSIDYIVSSGYMNGTGNGSTFSPKDAMTRAMIVSVMWRIAGQPAPEAQNPFNDLETSQTWYHDAVVWAYENGIVTGTSQTTFAPTQNVTREQMATFVYRFAKYLGYNTYTATNLNAFPDGESVGTWAKYALAWANDKKLITGTVTSDGATLLAPQSEATREQVATILMRFCKAYPAE